MSESTPENGGHPEPNLDFLALAREHHKVLERAEPDQEPEPEPVAELEPNPLEPPSVVALLKLLGDDTDSPSHLDVLRRLLGNFIDTGLGGMDEDWHETRDRLTTLATLRALSNPDKARLVDDTVTLLNLLVPEPDPPPREVKASQRRHKRIMPSKLGQVGQEWANDNPKRARRFSLAGHQPELAAPGSQLWLPGFCDPDTPSPSLPVELYHLGAATEAEKRGRGAPLAQRLLVESVLAVPQKHRDGQPIAFSVPLRELLDWLYPRRQPKPNEYWPRLMAACKALDSDAARVPILDHETGRWERRRIVTVGGIPRGPGALDDSVRIIVDLPSGSEEGPQVSDNLRLWGGQSQLAYNLLLNFALLWHHPGRTLVPAERGEHWLKATDLSRYEPLAHERLVRLAYGPEQATAGRRRDRVEKVLAALSRLEEGGELHVTRRTRDELLIVPPGAGRAERH